MFLGEFQHSLDDKGRLILPVKFRDRLAEGAVITKVLDGCLAVWAADEFERVANEMLEKARRGGDERNVMRSLAAGAAEVALDRQGRIPIPANLRTFAGLEKDVTVNGAFNRIEIWDRERWQGVNEQGEQALAEAGAGLADFI